MGGAALFQLDEYVLPEVDLQAQAADAFDKLLLPPAMWTAFPAGHLLLNGQQASRLRRIGLKPGWPDHLVLHLGDLIGIEWKKPGAGKLSKSGWGRTKRGKPRWIEGQTETFEKLTAAGMMGPYVCTSIDHAFHVLKAHGVPMRWREQ